MNLKNYSKGFRTLVLMCLLSFAFGVSAQNGWEKVKELPTTNAFHIAKNGNFILSDFQYDFTGGIYVSTDKGATWKKTAAPDYNYNIYCETDEYIFTAGCCGRVARSNDGGLSWEILNYGRAVEDLLGEDGVEYTSAYAITMHDGKLFLADFNGGGVVYSEDNGETWVATDYETLSYGDVDPKLGRRTVENIYNLVSYEGNLYAFGVYFVFKYIPETNSWETIRSDSNFMAISTIYKGKLCLGRSVENYTIEEDFLVTLDPEGQWGAVPRPDTDDNNVRAMYADGDDLFVGMAKNGCYYTNNEGASWSKLNKRYPGGVPMQLRTDKDYVYLAVYDLGSNSGLWRLAKSELPDNTDGIDHVNVDATPANVYDLTGRRVESDLNPGVYIVNGKKVWMK